MKTIYIDNKKKKYSFDLDEDTIIYHFSIDNSNDIEINLNKENINLYYYYSTINYNDNVFNIRVNHNKSNTNSYVYNHGINVYENKLHFRVDGYVDKKSYDCSCNQDNQIINIRDGNSKIWPNLLIDNYDVDANHAAYIGKFSEEKIFYLITSIFYFKRNYLPQLDVFFLQKE